MARDIIGQSNPAESQLHQATRFQRRENHSKVIDIQGYPTRVSMMSVNGCFVCHKSEFEILDSKGGEKCSPHSSLKAVYEDA